jgi:hypothetical protein
MERGVALRGRSARNAKKAALFPMTALGYAFCDVQRD